MAVVTAGMHLAGNFRGVIAAGPLADMERVEIGSEPDRLLPWPRAAQRADDPRLGDSFRDLDAPFPQARGDEARGAMLLEAGLGMAMDVAADGDEVRLVTLQRIGQHDAPFLSHGAQDCPKRHLAPLGPPPTRFAERQRGVLYARERLFRCARA